MCFSPEASFAVGGALIPAGLYCVRSAWLKNPRLITLAVVPLVFAAQQITEGFVWLAFHGGDAARIRSASLVYLFFAVAFWPWWFSVVAAVAEENPRRRLLFIALAVVTSAWFWILFYPLVVGPESLLVIEVVHHSIQYSAPELPVNRALSYPVVALLYALSMGAPMLFGVPVLRRAPVICLLVTVLLTAALYHYAFVSVWCFFAALSTISLCMVFHRLPAANPTPAATPEERGAAAVALGTQAK